MDYDAIIREFYIRNGANYFPLGTGVTIAGEKQNVSRVFQVSFSICLFNSRPLQQSGSETAIQVAACCLQELPATCCITSMIDRLSNIGSSTGEKHALSHSHPCLLYSVPCPLSPVLCPLSSVMCPLFYVPCLLPLVLCPWSSVHSPLSPVLCPCLLSLVLCPLSPVHYPLSPIFYPLSSVL